MKSRIMTDEEYKNLYNFKENKWIGPCTKNTKWCWTKKYFTPHYGHLYNKETFKCCHENLIYLLKKLSEASKKFNFSFFLDFGSLLGCLRNSRKIPYDADMDVSLCPDQFENFKKAKGFLEENGEKIRSTCSGFTYQLSLTNKIHIDIFYYRKKIKNKEISNI